jgi:hypothetical protein
MHACKLSLAACMLRLREVCKSRGIFIGVHCKQLHSSSDWFEKLTHSRSPELRQGQLIAAAVRLIERDELCRRGPCIFRYASSRQEKECELRPIIVSAADQARVGTAPRSSVSSVSELWLVRSLTRVRIYINRSVRRSKPSAHRPIRASFGVDWHIALMGDWLDQFAVEGIGLRPISARRSVRCGWECPSAIGDIRP